MSFFRLPRFIRRFIRRRTSEIPQDRASRVKINLSLAYAFIGWNLFGFLAYMIYSERIKKVEDDGSLSQGRKFVKMLKLENVHLYHIDGLKSVEHFDLNQEFTKKSEATTSQDDQKLEHLQKES
ncbi:uncharacterized protein LOC121876525 isoform X2 [Homarus americanus]|uniref:uncharacterized protein LOC121876525 isoform X2 n=1 Tax=Homarus americanus TaxID=6706 RepID=UPI001C471DFC|nr:uncharacterized protein LOC121876525 isoform X2 [Homarus americanus]XP_042237637.1 uncharacterized protein LOC121876525 isoform X2 [Homarus americanus]XP_042237638.1 uncharacterized protein LOC121876525 isoform X2 [Homarus americanus]